MKPYTFFKITDLKATKTIEVELYENRDEAEAHAQAILSEGRHIAIEVYDGSEFFMVGQPDRNSGVIAS